MRPGMFHDIPRAMLVRVRELVQIYSRERTAGTPRMKRLRQIPPDVGKFIAIVAAAAPAGRCIEVGTSAGYSTLWLALGCRAAGRRITTYEILDEKAELARQTFEAAGAGDVVELVHGDALDHLPGGAELPAGELRHTRYWMRRLSLPGRPSRRPVPVMLSSWFMGMLWITCQDRKTSPSAFSTPRRKSMTVVMRRWCRVASLLQTTQSIMKRYCGPCSIERWETRDLTL